MNYLRNVLKKNPFLSALVDKCIKIFLDEQFSQKILEHTVLKKVWFSFTISWYVCPMFENTLTKKASTAIFHFVKLKLFLNHQHD